MSMIKENPLLFGCLALLGVASLVACSGVVAMYFLADEFVEAASEKLEELGAEAGRQAGLKDPMGTAQEFMTSGWNLGINVPNEQVVEFTLVPQSGEAVDCEKLRTMLFPHLSGGKETVIVRSENRAVGEDGTVTTTPVECKWTGYPGRDALGGPIGQPATAPASEASEDSTAGEAPEVKEASEAPEVEEASEEPAPQ